MPAMSEAMYRLTKMMICQEDIADAVGTLDDIAAFAGGVDGLPASLHRTLRDAVGFLLAAYEALDKVTGWRVEETARRTVKEGGV